MTDELAELKKRVAELEKAAKPPAPFDPGPIQRFDYTAGMSMPASALRDMVNAVPTDMIREIAMRDGRAPTGPSAQGVVPSSQPMGSVRVGGGNTVPLGPPPGVAQADRIVDAFDRRDRHELMMAEARRQALLKDR
jgi:hypothetical protein